MTNEDKPAFTVFSTDDAWFNNSGTWSHFATLQEVIDAAAAFYDSGASVPVAWAQEAAAGYGGVKSYKDLRAESIAAGRVIKLIDGKYVPLGVAAEEKEEPPLLIDERGNKHQVKRGCGCVDCQAFAIGAPLPNAAMIARDGPAKPTLACAFKCEWPNNCCQTKSAALPPLRSLTLSTDLEPASHQVRAAFGSAALRSQN